jgi:hypothetical protein
MVATAWGVDRSAPELRVFKGLEVLPWDLPVRLNEGSRIFSKGNDWSREPASLSFSPSHLLAF